MKLLCSKCNKEIEIDCPNCGSWTCPNCGTVNTIQAERPKARTGWTKTASASSQGLSRRCLTASGSDPGSLISWSWSRHSLQQTGPWVRGI